MPRPVIRRRLENGLRLLIQPLPHHTSVSVGLAVLTGSRDERPGEEGFSHFAEHMLFQGTRTRSVRELSRVITAVGGHLDAFTGRESTAYYAKLPSRHAALALDVLGDMAAHSRFHTSSLDKEKKVVLEEVRMVDDTPDELVHDLFAQALFPRHALGRPILGSRRRLRQLTRRELVGFVRRHYHPHRMILAVAGGVEPAAVQRWAQRYLGGLPSPGECAEDGPAVAAGVGRDVVKHRKLEQAHLCLGFRGIPFSDSRRLAAMALSNILGGATNSRLFYQIRERRALAYTVYSFLDFYRDTGVLGVYLACHPSQVGEAARLVREEVHRLATRPVTDREWRDVREQMQGNLWLACESSSSHMWHMIQHETYLGQHPSLESTLQAIRRLTKEDLQQVAAAFTENVRPSLAVVGPVGEHPFRLHF